MKDTGTNFLVINPEIIQSQSEPAFSNSKSKKTKTLSVKTEKKRKVFATKVVISSDYILIIYIISGINATNHGNII